MGGQARSQRLSAKLITENISILSQQMCNISASILNLKLFDTFSHSDMVQSIGFNTNKMRLGINQIFIKMQTFEDFLDFLHKSPANEQQRNLWHFICNSQ